VLVLCYSNDQLKNFVASYSQILSIIKESTGQIFVPTVVQSSPTSKSDEGDLLIVLRSIERMDKLRLDTECILDDKKLSRQFLAKNFRHPRGESLDEMRGHLRLELE
jgi:hypothetical protein